MASRKCCGITLKFPFELLAGLPSTPQQQRCMSAFHWLESSGALRLLGCSFLLALIGAQMAQAQTYAYKMLHRFNGVPTDGADPGSAGVVLDSAGNLYGTTQFGGNGACQLGCGVVYKLNKAGKETVLYNFTGGADGANPYAGVVLDSSGNLYGTTPFGGARNKGVVFKVDASGHEAALLRFTGSNGHAPYAGVVLDSVGNLYGTTYYGGGEDVGVVYQLSTSGQDAVLYSFTKFHGGARPYAGVVLDSAGNLYGATSGISSDGSNDPGVVFKLTP